MINSKGQLSNSDNYIIFSVKSNLEGSYCQPFCFRGPAAFVMGVRAFRNVLESLDSKGPLRPSDLSLWIVGEFDLLLGKLLSYDSPVDPSLIEEVSNA